MRRADHVRPAGAWPRERARATVTLTYDDRHRRRVRLVADDGDEFLLDLADAIVLRDGDGLRLDDGAWLAVCAANEQVCEIACPTPEALARIAWHLGNRHLPVQIIDSGLRIRDDHVIVAMLEGLGAAVTRRNAPFEPEGGAYARAHRHAHAHGHAHPHHHHD
jgi:urease accessory protein